MIFNVIIEKITDLLRFYKRCVYTLFKLKLKVHQKNVPTTLSRKIITSDKISTKLVKFESFPKRPDCKKLRKCDCICSPVTRISCIHLRFIYTRDGLPQDNKIVQPGQALLIKICKIQLPHVLESFRVIKYIW